MKRRISDEERANTREQEFRVPRSSERERPSACACPDNVSLTDSNMEIRM